MLDSLKQIWPARPATTHWLWCLLASSCLFGCSKSDKSATVSQQQSGVTTTTVTSGGADSSLAFYTERYISSDERMKRRQDRLEAALSRQK